eukprot:2847425-Amphidinium_carterae.1
MQRNMPNQAFQNKSSAMQMDAAIFMFHDAGCDLALVATDMRLAIELLLQYLEEAFPRRRLAETFSYGLYALDPHLCCT